MKPVNPNHKHDQQRGSRRQVRLVLGTLALVFIFIGIAQGEFQQVLQKAIRVCLECIGIG